MTLKKLSAISLVASTLLVGSLSANEAGKPDGVLAMRTAATTTIATELYQLSTELNVSVIGTLNNPMTYTANIANPTSVSDPQFELTFSSDVEITAARDIYVVDDANNTVTLAGVVDATNPKLIKFTSNDTVQIDNGKVYTVYASTALGSALGTSVTATAVSNGLNTLVAEANVATTKVDLELWSMSGTPSLQDVSTLNMLSVTPEYTVTCENKFDNLINVEDASNTFIVTSHGRNITANATDGNVTDILRFNVARATVDYTVGDNTDSKLVFTADGNTSLSGFANPGTATLADATVTPAGTWGVGADITYAANDLDFNLTSANALVAGTNASYTLLYTNTDSDQVINEVNFVASYYIGSGSTNGAGIAAGDYNTSYTPAGSSSLNVPVGEWSNFAYISQIGAVSYAPGITNVKFYITNRSCAATTPNVKLIRGGETVETTLDAIAVDTQGKITIDEIANKVISDGNTLPGVSGPFAVEITLAGNSEDFYIAAQMDNGEKIKDLPVYNTSTRSY